MKQAIAEILGIPEDDILEYYYTQEANTYSTHKDFEYGVTTDITEPQYVVNLKTGKKYVFLTEILEKLWEIKRK